MRELSIVRYVALSIHFAINTLLRFTGIQNYVRKKMRTVLKAYGYKRRTAALMSHMRDCMMFYHIQTYLSGERECDIREISLDDMITFRVI